MEFDGFNVALLIPVLAIVLGIGVAFWSIYWDHQKKRLLFEERRLMIERGMTPPEFPVDMPWAMFKGQEGQQMSPEASLRHGTVQLFLGIGLALGYFVLRASSEDWGWVLGAGGAIVGLLGMGNLVYYFIARSRKSETTSQTPV